ncbi:acyl-CoA dehydrogenase family protein [Sansalvadorimonas sp. 2012CJ34-2]|uniref:Acyl-CoA dehydrogenase family protein n=1 Tax=Parendozoicomonas callyspongiae TaxID=2942213 RepID=A0ABT0PG94_9GAMM|nr:acyl-CoA dehydrogenase family protein [Sansalvadorimonas sp. 2012CJ34-2]MCL6270374.1 acyl-CoA dehydrogenase family protein [Sansalvadorimonas sp. 2012CJ34-2]
MKELSDILRKPAFHCPDIQIWKSQRLFTQPSRPLSTLKEAFLAGCRADRMAWAFCGGYQWAIRSLLPELTENTDVLALCISESGGGHPRKILSSLEPVEGGYVLSGKKTFITCGTEADRLLIAARTGEQADGKPDLKMLILPARGEGFSVSAMPALPIVPELPHASVVMDRITVSEKDVLPGDGYLQYIRPFRMHEDLHVQAALAGLIARKGFELEQQEILEESLSCFYALQGIKLMGEEPSNALALSAVEPRLRELATRTINLISNSEEKSNWQRDVQIMEVAGKARAIRRKKAWDQLVS